MANPEHVKKLKQGVDVWNRWWEDHPFTPPDFTGENLERMDLRGYYLIKADFSGANLSGANLSRANLREACLREADLVRADLSEARLRDACLNEADLTGAYFNKANLTRAKLINAKMEWARFQKARLMGANLSESTLNHADFRKANLGGANIKEAHLKDADLSSTNLSAVNLSGTDLREADLNDADLRKADLSGTDFSGARLSEAVLKDAILTGAKLIGTDLTYSTLVDTNLSNTTLSDCKIFGISAWRLTLDSIKEQSNLTVTPDNESTVTVDNLQVAQFVYLLLHNPNIRGIIDTIGEKGVLILGRFTEERKAVLDAIRDKLRELGFVPMMFDFEKPTQRDFTETIKTLAGMSRFIIADITKPKSAPLEFQAIVPDYMIPLVPIIQEGEEPFSMFVDLQNKYEWVLDVREYPDANVLLDKMESAIIRPALEKSGDMLMKRASGIRKKQIEEWQ